MNGCNYCQPGAICPYHGNPEITALRERVAELEAAAQEMRCFACRCYLSDGGIRVIACRECERLRAALSATAIQAPADPAKLAAQYIETLVEIGATKPVIDAAKQSADGLADYLSRVRDKAE